MSKKYLISLVVTACLGVLSLTLMNYRTMNYSSPVIQVHTKPEHLPEPSFENHDSEHHNQDHHSREHELARMRLMENLEDMIDYIDSYRFQQEQNGSLVLQDFENRYRRVMLQVKRLDIEDNADHWKEKEHSVLSDLIQRRISYLQNPRNCSRARKLVCPVEDRCGLGCTLHHLTTCFMTAYGTQRTMFIQSKGWRYLNGKSLDAAFLPVSETCKNFTIEKRNIKEWTGENQTDQVVVIPFSYKIKNPPLYRPFSVPEDLASRLENLTPQPGAWFVSQFVKYILRPREGLKQVMERVKERRNHSEPIVGIHVRRGDKSREAAAQPLSRYIEHVERWYELEECLTNRSLSRILYVATDDETVIEDLKANFSTYDIIANQASKDNSDKLWSNADESMFYNIMEDIYSLSNCDFVVCTFSSSMCRLMYEIMLANSVNATSRVKSLDRPYFSFCQIEHLRVVVENQESESPSTLTMKIGDVLAVDLDNRNGFKTETHMRLKNRVSYPCYKTEERMNIVKYPTYPEVPLHVCC